MTAKEAELLALAERLRERIAGFTSMLGERMWMPSRSHIQTDMKLMQDAAEMLDRLAAAPCPGREAEEANRLISQIEERFPNWMSYRDLVDCIDCTLHNLREGRR